MIPQLPPNPPHLHIPKYIPDYSSHHILSRPKLTSPSFFSDISRIVSSAVSPVEPSPAHPADDSKSSPHSPSAGPFSYANRVPDAFNSPVSPVELYESGLSDSSYSTASSYPQPTTMEDNYSIINNTSSARAPNVLRPYDTSESPSPVSPSSSFVRSQNDPLILDRTSDDTPSYHSGGDRFHPSSSQSVLDRYGRNPVADKFYADASSQPQNTMVDHRRMSEPSVLGAANLYAVQPSEASTARPAQYSLSQVVVQSARPSNSAYVPSLQRGVSMSSLRDLRQFHHENPSTSQPDYSHWRADSDSVVQRTYSLHREDGLDVPISPLQPDFSGGATSPTYGMQYSPSMDNHYGPSPPNTATSSSSAPAVISQAHASQNSSDGGSTSRDPNSKTYSFVALPGNAVKKRPRRRYDEIERLYQCSWPDCSKAYGTLNHLNAHVTMQKHGPKRSPNEFKELRKQWRKAKKDSESPISGPLRRGSMGLRPDGGETYDHRRFDAHKPSNLSAYDRQPSHQPSVNFPSSMPNQNSGRVDRYMSLPDLQFPIDERDSQVLAYGMNVRHHYSGDIHASWPIEGTALARSALQPFMSTSLPEDSTIHHSHMSHLGSSTQPQQQQLHPPRSLSPQAATNRLPPDSTLLTPLPGYHHPPLLPPLQSNHPSDTYYDTAPRPGTGHGPFDQGHLEEH